MEVSVASTNLTLFGFGPVGSSEVHNGYGTTTVMLYSSSCYGIYRNLIVTEHLHSNNAQDGKTF